MWKQYCYIEHRIQGLQDFVDYIFREVLFHAPEHRNEDLMAVVDEPTKKLLDEVRECKFYQQLSKLYEKFKDLDDEKIKSLNTAFGNNNQIERLCRGEIKSSRFKDLLKGHKDDRNWKALLMSLKEFCNELYEEHINLKAFQNRYGTMNEYYKTLVSNDSICHCCGIESILTVGNTPRDAFDHYLPKAIYPFISLNFHNLVPTCPHCNSSYKKEKDTLFEKRGTREIQVKSFFPFMNVKATAYQIKVDIELTSIYKKEKTKSKDIIIICSCAGHEEEMRTWQRIYQIDERYRSFCHSDQTLNLVNDIINCNLISPGYAKLEIQKMERLSNISGNFLRASFTKAVFKSLGVTI